MKFERILFGAALFALLAGKADADVLYSQPWDGTGSSYASQNDTTSGGMGNFAIVYDNFTLTRAANLDGVEFVGSYPGSLGTITAFTLFFYADNAGIPGAPIAVGIFPGNGGETLISGANYDYGLFFGDFFVNAGTYWLSIVPDLALPPQWAWDTSSVGDDNSYRCFSGTCGSLGVDFAFSIDGTSIPEPVTLSLFGAGLTGVAALRRRKRVKS